jgi:hypothetical protein
MYPHNQGIVPDFQSRPVHKSAAASSSSFQCHLPQEVGKKTFQTYLNFKDDHFCDSHVQQEENHVQLPPEMNLIEL